MILAKATSQTTKKKRQNEHIEKHLLDGAFFVPEELIQAIESNPSSFVNASPSNPWSTVTCISFLCAVARPFSVKSKRPGSKQKESFNPARTITDFPNDVEGESDKREEVKSESFGFVADTKPKTSSTKEREEAERPRTEFQHENARTQVSNEERVHRAKSDLSKITEELEAIVAERNKKKQSLINEFNSLKENVREKTASEETKNSNPPSTNKGKVVNKTKELSEEEIEKRSKENLARLEKKLKALDPVKEETFSKLTAYIAKIQTAKDENGELIMKDGNKIDELAAIMKDYQREAWTSFDQNSIPGLIEERARGSSAATVLLVFYL
eukprot:TRINITY_DN13805_c0_g1_i2.p1 TRINITY_DN13805_c0_g1~~TRINITY_DN13805_c0_g1_i2.p1  ORF type:complete len:328 (-),score=94.41 TRINITY_DN13805_c0_g1_i2:1607-2590(-)